MRGGPVLALVALVATGLALWHYLDAVTAGPPTTFDDAYMYVRYAKQLLAGRGVAWNPDCVPTFGATSLLFMAVVTALRGLTDWTDAGVLRVASTGAALAAVAVMAFTGWRHTRSETLRRNAVLWTAFVAAPLLASPTVVYHSRTGIDTTLALLVNSLVVLATLRMVARETAGSVVPVVVAGYLAVLSRPDNGLYATAFPALAILLCVPRPAKVRLLVTFGVAIVAVLGLDALAKVVAFGVPLPLSAYAKTQGHFVGYAGAAQWNAMAYLLEFLAVALPFLCVIVACAGRRSLAHLALFLVPTVLTLGVYFGMLQMMGYRARFDFPSLPFVVILAALALDRFALDREEQDAAFTSSIGARAVAVVSMIALLPAARTVLPSWYEAEFIPSVAADEPPNPGKLPTLRYWEAIDAMIEIATNAPAGTVVSMSEYGGVGAAAPEVTILDPLGLHDAEVARHGFSAERLFERDPDLIWMPHPDYVSMRRDIARSDELWREYDVYPAAFLFGAAVRKSGPRAEAIRALFEEAWREAYPGQSLQAHRAVR